MISVFHVWRQAAADHLSASDAEPTGGPARVERHRGLDVWPVRLLVFLVAVLVWAIVRENLSPSWVGHWPWRLTLLGAAPAAALAGGLLALIATRRQLTLTVEPHLGWVSSRDASVILGDKSAWRVVVTNSGGGRAIVKQVLYRVAGVGQPVEDEPWVSVDAARSQLVTLGLVEDQDFALRRIGTGAGMGVGKDYGVEALALTAEALDCVCAVDIRIRYQSATRDTYERVMPLLPREGVPGSIVVRAATSQPCSGESVEPAVVDQ